MPPTPPTAAATATTNGDGDGDDSNCPQCNTLSRATPHPTYPPVLSIHSADDPCWGPTLPIPPFVSLLPDLRREIVGPSPLLCEFASLGELVAILVAAGACTFIERSSLWKLASLGVLAAILVAQGVRLHVLKQLVEK